MQRASLLKNMHTHCKRLAVDAATSTARAWARLPKFPLRKNMQSQDALANISELPIRNAHPCVCARGALGKFHYILKQLPSMALSQAMVARRALVKILLSLAGQFLLEAQISTPSNVSGFGCEGSCARWISPTTRLRKNPYWAEWHIAPE